jgi:hypothetical protein
VVPSLDRLRIELHDHGVVFSISPEPAGPSAT